MGEERLALVQVGEGISLWELAPRAISDVTSAPLGPILQCLPPQSPTCRSHWSCLS